MKIMTMALMKMMRCAEKGGWSLMGVTEMPVTTSASASNVGSCFA